MIQYWNGNHKTESFSVEWSDDGSSWTHLAYAGIGMNTGAAWQTAFIQLQAGSSWDLGNIAGSGLDLGNIKKVQVQGWLKNGLAAPSWQACLDACAATENCRQVVYKKSTKLCYGMTAASDADQEAKDGTNTDYISAHCEVPSWTHPSTMTMALNWPDSINCGAGNFPESILNLVTASTTSAVYRQVHVTKREVSFGVDGAYNGFHSLYEQAVQGCVDKSLAKLTRAGKTYRFLEGHTTTMVAGFPDAINCGTGGAVVVFQMHGAGSAGGWYFHGQHRQSLAEMEP